MRYAAAFTSAHAHTRGQAWPARTGIPYVPVRTTAPCTYVYVHIYIAISDADRVSEPSMATRYQRGSSTATKRATERAIREAGRLIPSLQETGRILGKGAYGEVVEVLVNGRKCAAKKLHGIFSARDVPPTEKVSMAERFEKECLRVLHLNHPNVVEMIGVFFDRATRDRLPTLVMELLDTSLSRYLDDNPCASVTPTVKCSILLDVATGLVYLHSLPAPLGPIVHRDLTANNVLLAMGEKIVAKIADLGQAKNDPAFTAQQQKLSKLPGNEDHMPPEAWIDEPVYNVSLDIFSFGVVMLHTLAHEWPKPLGKLASVSQVRKEVDRRKKYLDKIESSLLKPLVIECLSDAPESRPVASEVLGALKLAGKLNPTFESMRNETTLLCQQVKSSRNDIASLHQQVSDLRLQLQAQEYQLQAQEYQLQAKIFQEQQQRQGILPRSIDVETQQRHGNREMNRIPHFSSGSNICRPAEDTREPETPVMGIIPATLMKKFPKPSQTGEVPPSKPTLRDVLPTEQDSNEMTHTSQAAVSPSQQVSHHQLASSMRSSDQPMQSSGSTPQPKEPTPPKVTSPTDRSKPPFQVRKSQPHVSPTMATADTGLTSESDQSRLDYGGDGARELRQKLNQNRKESQEDIDSIDIYGSGPTASSIDIYGSGPTTHRQFSAPSYVPTVPEEPGWDMVSASDVPPDGVAAPPHPTPRSTKPALMTQGGQDKQPHALESEAVASQLKEAPYPKPRKLRNKTQSVDEAEDHNRGERRHHGMKTSRSGPNLLELENNSQTLDETSPQKLKPKPRPRASRSPSPVSSPENSPSNSPVARRRNPQPPTDEQSSLSPSPRLKARPGGMLPRIRSMDVETQRRHGNREMNRIPHFSSGSNICQPALTTREPETAVMGIIPATLMKKFPKPSQTGEVPPSKPTLRDVLPTEQDSNEMTHTSQAAMSPSQQVSHHQLASSMRSSDQPMQSSGSTPQPKEPTPPKVTSPTDRSKPPFHRSPFHRSQPHVSPTMATVDTGLTSESDQSRLDYGGDGTRALRQNLNQDRKESQEDIDPIKRERGNVTSRGSGNKSLKSESAPATDKTSFTEDDTAKDATPGNKTGFEYTLT